MTSKERFALWRQRVETYGGFQLTKPESLELFAEIGRLQSDNATLLESRREIACDLARTESARSALLAENTHYKDACAEFVKMQHDIASLLEVDAETDSIDLHQRIYGELQRRASSEPLAALDARLDGVKREMATNLYSRAAAVLRAYAQDAGDDHSVGICNCSDIALVDELDTAARASQPPGDVPGLLHTLEVLRQRWSHNVNFEATIGACITEIELCAAGSTSSAVTGPARTVVE